ncbi:hypothetical protein GWK47_047631 [Chionoecetes opilio]|uniref:N-acetyltransferase domain-containing protein n=1 Tax=Chionoecetes opilio TaxID=41210 RepID=A0A8J5CV55_CHIOP|nr:hypothetical protein GWK47_047631 [Chionoecetes opilio]
MEGLSPQSTGLPHDLRGTTRSGSTARCRSGPAAGCRWWRGSPATGRLAGHTAGHHPDPPAAQHLPAGTQTALKPRLCNTVYRCWRPQWTSFARYQCGDRILELAMITVSEQMGDRGVGRRLVQESEQRGPQLGCQLATAQATAVPSQRLLYRLGTSRSTPWTTPPSRSPGGGVCLTWTRCWARPAPRSWRPHHARPAGRLRPRVE